jgi:hypothetical protein
MEKTQLIRANKTPQKSKRKADIVTDVAAAVEEDRRQTILGLVSVLDQR